MEHESDDDSNCNWNMKVTVIPIVISAFGTVTKGLVKGLEDLEIRRCMETIQTTALLSEYWDESWRLEETCCPSNSSKRAAALADGKNSQEVK